MKQIIFLFLGTIAFIIVVGIFSKDINQKTQSSPSLVKEEVTIGNTRVLAQVADDEAERKKGLGGRESLPENEGMLFVFPQSSSGVSFWMKEMKFPLDIIWISDEKVVKIDKNAQPEPGISDNALRRYTPGAEVKYVLEVNAGFSDRNDLKTGDSVSLY